MLTFACDATSTFDSYGNSLNVRTRVVPPDIYCTNYSTIHLSGKRSSSKRRRGSRFAVQTIWGNVYGIFSLPRHFVDLVAPRPRTNRTPQLSGAVLATRNCLSPRGVIASLRNGRSCCFPPSLASHRIAAGFLHCRRRHSVLAPAAATYVTTWAQRDAGSRLWCLAGRCRRRCLVASLQLRRLTGKYSFSVVAAAAAAR